MNKENSQTPVQATPTPANNVQPPTTARRSAKKVREQREAMAAKRRLSEQNNTVVDNTPQTIKTVRPHYFELQNADQYATQEALNAAVDAMLAVEAAEDQGLPAPHTNVSPAVRVMARIRPNDLAPTTITPRPAQRPASHSSQRTTPHSKSVTKTREPNADKRSAQLKEAEADKSAERRRLLEKAQQLKEEQQRAEQELKRLEQEEEASQEVGKKRKRVKIDDLKVIPSRRPGQSSGTFALLDEFFDYDDDSVEMDEDEIQLMSARPNKMARTENNIFDTSPATTTPLTAMSLDTFVDPELTVNKFAVPDSPDSPPPDSPTPTAAMQSEALLRKRSEAERYKPTRGSRLREVQRISTGSSATGSPFGSPFTGQQSSLLAEPAAQPLYEELESAEPASLEFNEPTSTLGLSYQDEQEYIINQPLSIIEEETESQLASPQPVYNFPPSTKVFSDEVIAEIQPYTQTQEFHEQAVASFEAGFAAFMAERGGNTDFSDILDGIEWDQAAADAAMQSSPAAPLSV